MAERLSILERLNKLLGLIERDELVSAGDVRRAGERFTRRVRDKIFPTPAKTPANRKPLGTEPIYVNAAAPFGDPRNPKPPIKFDRLGRRRAVRQTVFFAGGYAEYKRVVLGHDRPNWRLTDRTRRDLRMLSSSRKRVVYGWVDRRDVIHKLAERDPDVLPTALDKNDLKRFTFFLRQNVIARVAGDDPFLAGFIRSAWRSHAVRRR